MSTESDGRNADGVDKKALARELAARAQDFFEVQNYDGAIASLQLLAKERPNNLKVEHNLAVASFYGKRTPTPALFDAVSRIYLQTQQGGKGDVFDEEIETSIITYNYALFMLQRAQYATAIAALEASVAVFDTIPEASAKKICFLLLDLYLLTNTPDKASGVLVYLDKVLTQLTGAQLKVGSEEQDEPSNTTPDADALKFFSSPV